MTKKVLKTIRLTSSALAISLALCAASGAFAEAKTYNFSIPAESTAKALMDFSRQAKIQILFPYEVVADRTSPAISGEYDRATVLKLLLDGSGLEIAHETDQVITLKAVGTAYKTSSSSDPDAPTEVIVTGTHIRGGNPTSPVHTLTRKDIDQSGYSQIGDLMRSLPENFSGGQNPGVQSGAAFTSDQNNNNVTNASTVNLRGLGSDATLVLLNGHRLSSDSAFQSSDISGIPLGAVQRVDVVTDGASAIYGADAVAGAVNFVLRRNLNGGELTGRVGDSTNGGGLERTASVLAGVTGSKGYLLANGEVSNQDDITWADRDITAIGAPSNTLLQAQKRQSLFLSGGWDISPQITLTLDGLVSNRDTSKSYQSSDASPLVLYHTVTPGFSAAAGLEVLIFDTWKVHLSAVDSGSRNSQNITIPDYDYQVQAQTWNSTAELEATADGTLISTPAGEIKAALGFGRRREAYRTSAGSDYNRSVAYAFVELLAPIIVPSETRTGLHELQFSIAGRLENYSDFGDSWNPKLGVRYVPFNALTFRATWGKSFKAPTFAQLYGTSQIYLFDATFMGGVGSGTALMTEGGNPDLRSEKANTWTLGAEFKPTRTLSLTATYFNVDYRDRVVEPVGLYTTALSNPIYSPFVTYYPSAELQADLISKASLFNNFSSSDYNPSDVVAAVYDTYANATRQQIQGLDAGYWQSFSLGDGRLNTYANGTWLELRQQTIKTAPDSKLSGTIFAAPKFKGRGGVTWEEGAWSLTGIINYIASEIDNVIVPNERIPSWTTLDVNLSYRTQPDKGVFSGVKLSLAASNLFNKMPPYTQTPIANTSPHFDSANTSIVGRFVTLTASKSW